MSKTSLEGTVLLVDIGTNENCLTRAKQCTSRMIQRKIFSDGFDEIGLILIGARKTKNKFNYPNINVKSDFLHGPNWDLLKYIKNLSPTNVNNADWLDGLIVAIDLLRTESDARTFQKKKIVMLSSYQNPVRSSHQVDTIIQSLNDFEIQLVVIDVQGFASENEVENEGYAILEQIVNNTQSVMCGFEEAMSQLAQFQSATTKTQPWYCDLQIGEDIFIPIAGFKKFAEKKLLNWQKRNVETKGKVLEESVDFLGDKQVQKSDVIKGYLFGQTVVPISADDKSSMKTDAEKCFQVIGFTKSSNVPRHILLGDSVYYILPRSDNKAAETSIQAMVRALQELDMVGIVRKVYARNSSPQIGALFPVKEQGSYFFYFAAVPFAEDERFLKLPSLNNIQPSDKQLSLIDDLIDSMDLSQLDNEEDPYSKVISPAVENSIFLITLKALNPEINLQSESSDDVKSMIRPMLEMLQKASDTLEDIKHTFNIEELEQKKYKRGATDVFDRDLSKRPRNEDPSSQIKVENIANFGQSTVTEVGTVDPENDFRKLLELKGPFDLLFDQMKSAIEKLIFASNNIMGNKKPLSALTLLRKHCVQQNEHKQYNEFIEKLRGDLLEREHEFWNLVVKDKLGLITSEESKDSEITADEADLFYDIKNITEITQSEPSLELEAEDMLDMI